MQGHMGATSPVVNVPGPCASFLCLLDDSISSMVPAQRSACSG